MPTVIKNKWDGGHAEDARAQTIDECQFSYNFDVFTDSYRLIPYPDSIAETVATDTMNDIELGDVDISLIGSTYTLTAIGNESSVSSKLAFWTKSAITNGSVLNWQKVAVAATGSLVQRSGFVYHDKYYGISTNVLFRFDPASTATSMGTFASTVKPLVSIHEDAVYGISGDTIYRFDGSAITKNVNQLIPSGGGMSVVSLEEYGEYIAIGLAPTRGNGEPVIKLWDRDMNAVDADQTIPLGEGNLLMIANLGNDLFAVMAPQNAFLTAFMNKIKIKRYSGGTVVTEKTLTILGNQNISFAKQKNGDKLYFGLNNDYAVYAFGINKNGQYILTQDKYFNNESIIGSSLSALNMIGDVLWRGFGTFTNAYVFMRSLISGFSENYTYNSTSIYRTTINPNMPVADRQLDKQLVAVKVSYTGTTGGIVGVQYSVDGSAFVYALMEGTVAGEGVKNTTAQLDDNAFLDGKEIVFQIESTGGVQIKELKYKYNVIAEVI